MNLAEHFSKAKLMVVGDIMLDRYWWGTVSRISPEAPVPIVKHEHTTTAPGGAANVAVNAAALGASIQLIGCVGLDAEADLLSESLLINGVKADHLVRTSSRTTSIKTRIISQGQQVARIDKEDTYSLNDDDADDVIKKINLTLQEVDLVIVSDYAKGVLSDSVLRELIQACNDLKKPIIVDPKGKDFFKYSGATMLTPNRSEAAEACKFEESMPNLVNYAGRSLLSEIEIGNILITESENGMTLFRKNAEPVHFNAAVHSVYDVTGAGDTVIACLGVALAAGTDIVEACRIANIAGGLSVQQIGTAPVTIGSLEDAVNSEAGKSEGIAS